MGVVGLRTRNSFDLRNFHLKMSSGLMHLGSFEAFYGGGADRQRERVGPCSCGLAEGLGRSFWTLSPEPSTHGYTHPLRALHLGSGAVRDPWC